jgi:hypothetical protein
MKQVAFNCREIFSVVNGLIKPTLQQLKELVKGHCDGLEKADPDKIIISY